MRSSADFRSLTVRLSGGLNRHASARDYAMGSRPLRSQEKARSTALTLVMDTLPLFRALVIGGRSCGTCSQRR
jgi:hypothetical protein